MMAGDKGANSNFVDYFSREFARTSSPFTTQRHEMIYKQRKIAQILLAIKVPFKIDVKLQYSSIEATPEPLLMRVLPILVGNLEREIFVRRSGAEENNARIVVSFRLDDFVVGRGTFVDEIRVKDVEFVALDDFWRRIVGAAASSLRQYHRRTSEKERKTDS